MEWLLVLLSEVCCHTTHRLRNTHTCVCACEYTHTHTQHAASTLYPKHCSCLLQYMHCAQESGFGSALSFFFLFSFFPPCFAVRAEFASKHFLYLNCCPGWKKPQTNVTIPCIPPPPSLMICLCFGHRHVKSIIGGRMLDEWMEECALLEADTKERSWSPLVVLTMSIWARANQFCVYLKHNGVPWERFIWLEIKGVQGVPISSARILKSTEEFSCLSFSRCLHADGASDDAGMMECRTDAEESELSKTDILNAAYTLYFSHTDMAECKYHCCASPTIKKEFSFLLSNHSSEYPLSYLPCPLR